MILHTPPTRVLSEGLVCDCLHKVVSLLRHLNKRLLVCQVRGPSHCRLTKTHDGKTENEIKPSVSDTGCPVESPLCGASGADKFQLTHWMVVHRVSGPVGLVAAAVQRSQCL